MRIGGTTDHGVMRAFALLTILAPTLAIGPRGAEANPPRDGWDVGIADDAPPSVIDGESFRDLGVKIFRFQVPTMQSTTSIE
jgi:hypothetical protein